MAENRQCVHLLADASGWSYKSVKSALYEIAYDTKKSADKTNALIAAIRRKAVESDRAKRHSDWLQFMAYNWNDIRAEALSAAHSPIHPVRGTLADFIIADDVTPPTTYLDTKAFHDWVSLDWLQDPPPPPLGWKLVCKETAHTGVPIAYKFVREDPEMAWGVGAGTGGRTRTV